MILVRFRLLLLPFFLQIVLLDFTFKLAEAETVDLNCSLKINFYLQGFLGGLSTLLWNIETIEFVTFVLFVACIIYESYSKEATIWDFWILLFGWLTFAPYSHGLKYQPILICICNIESGFEVSIDIKKLYPDENQNDQSVPKVPNRNIIMANLVSLWINFYEELSPNNGENALYHIDELNS